MEAIGTKIVECVMKDFLEDINSKVSEEDLQKIKSLIEDFKGVLETPSEPSISAPVVTAPTTTTTTTTTTPSISPPVVTAPTTTTGAPSCPCGED